MGLLEFSKLPINTLVGADWKTFKGVTEGRIVDKGYKQKYYLTKSVCRLLSLLQPFEDRKYKKLLADKKIENDPVFILGHWRAEQLLSIMYFPAINNSDIIQLIKQYFPI